MRTLIAGIVGGIVVFGWGAVSHMVLHLSENTIKPLSNPDKVIGTMKSDVTEPGMYTFPYCSPEQMKDEKAKAKFEQEYKNGPNGLIVRGRDGEAPVSNKEFALQLGACIVGAFILALFLGAGTSVAGAVTRAFAGAGFGVFAWVTQSAPMYIWYRFPWDYEQAVLIDSVIEWSLAAFVMALILKKKEVAKAK